MEVVRWMCLPVNFVHHIFIFIKFHNNELFSLRDCDISDRILMKSLGKDDSSSKIKLNKNLWNKKCSHYVIYFVVGRKRDIYAKYCELF